MRFLGWFRGPKPGELEREREETRKTKGQLATKVVELDNARFHLDDMVKRSIVLLGGKDK